MQFDDIYILYLKVKNQNYTTNKLAPRHLQDNVSEQGLVPGKYRAGDYIYYNNYIWELR